MQKMIFKKNDFMKYFNRLPFYILTVKFVFYKIVGTVKVFTKYEK